MQIEQPNRPDAERLRVVFGTDTYGGAVSQESTQLMRRRSSVKGVDTTQEAQGRQAGEAPEQYSMKKVLSGERAGAASLAML